MGQSLYALLGAVFGGIGLKTIEAIFSRHNKKIDESTSIRIELREEVKQLRDRMDKQDAELDEWKSKYYELLSENAALRAAINALNDNSGRIIVGTRE